MYDLHWKRKFEYQISTNRWRQLQHIWCCSSSCDQNATISGLVVIVVFRASKPTHVLMSFLTCLQRSKRNFSSIFLSSFYLFLKMQFEWRVLGCFCGNRREINVIITWNWADLWLVTIVGAAEVPIMMTTTLILPLIIIFIIKLVLLG